MITSKDKSRWVTEKEVQVLCDLIKEHNIEEVYECGTANGYSACRMAETGAFVTTFDPVDRVKIWNTPKYSNCKDKIRYFPQPFSELSLTVTNKKRLFFIDGNHGATAVANDIQTSVNFIIPGDIIVLHDMNMKTVVKAWQRMDKSGFDHYLVKTERDMAVLIRKKDRLLKDIAYETGTDKKHTRHNFVSIYEDMFNNFRYEKFKLLEIGVYLGRSHNMWVEYFPNATIYGIDIDQKTKRYEKPRLSIDIVDQSSKEQLLAYAKKEGSWKIIIDDGSHINSHQKISFETLWDYVEPGGYYIIEDTHSSYWKHLMDSDETLMQYMLNLTDHICTAPHYKGYYSGIDVRRANETLSKWQEEIEYLPYRSGILIIKKRK